MVAGSLLGRDLEPDGVLDAMTEWETEVERSVSEAETEAATLVASTLPDLIDDEASRELADRGVPAVAGLRSALVCAQALRIPAANAGRLREIAAAVQEDGRVHAQRDAAVGVDRARLPVGVAAHELDRVRVRGVVLDVVRRDDLERDRELLEDRLPLGRGRGERQPGFRAAQISSTGHFLAQSAVTKE